MLSFTQNCPVCKILGKIHFWVSFANELHFKHWHSLKTGRKFKIQLTMKCITMKTKKQLMSVTQAYSLFRNLALQCWVLHGKSWVDGEGLMLDGMEDKQTFPTKHSGFS